MEKLREKYIVVPVAGVRLESYADKELRELDEEFDTGVKALWCEDDQTIVAFLFNPGRFNEAEAQAWVDAVEEEGVNLDIAVALAVKDASPAYFRKLVELLRKMVPADLFSKAVKVARAHAGGKASPKPKPENDEDNEGDDEESPTPVGASLEDESFEDISRRLREAISKQFGEPKLGPSYETGGPWLSQVYRDYCIVEWRGDTFKVPYSFDEDDNIVLGEPEKAKQVYVAAALALIWEETENEIRFRVRDPDDFRSDTFRRKKVSGIEGVSLILAKLKPDNVPEGHDPDAMVVQAYRFDKDNWTMAEAKAWIAKQKKAGKLTLALDLRAPLMLFHGSPRNPYGTHASYGYPGGRAGWKKAWRIYLSQINGGKVTPAACGPLRGTVRRLAMIAAGMKPPCTLPSADNIPARTGPKSPLPGSNLKEKPSDYGLKKWKTPSDDNVDRDKAMRLTCQDLQDLKRLVVAELKRRIQDREAEEEKGKAVTLRLATPEERAVLTESGGPCACGACGTQAVHIFSVHLTQDEPPGNADDDLIWKEVLAVGTTYRPATGDEVIITQEMVDSIADAFEAGVLENVAIAADDHHHEAGGIVPAEKTVGFVKAIKKVGGRLWAGLKLLDEKIREKLDEGLIQDVSVYAYPDFHDRRDGKKWPWVLVHLLLTNYPQLVGLAPFGEQPVGAALGLEGAEKIVYRKIEEVDMSEEGALTLTQEQAKDFEAFQGLGLSVEEIQAMLAERQTVLQKARDLEISAIIAALEGRGEHNGIVALEGYRHYPVVIKAVEEALRANGGEGLALDINAEGQSPLDAVVLAIVNAIPQEGRMALEPQPRGNREQPGEPGGEPSQPSDEAIADLDQRLS